MEWNWNWDLLVPSCESPAVTSFPEGFHLDSNPRKPVPVSNPGFNNFRKCFKYTKYNGEYNSHSQATVAQGIRGFASIPRVTYRWGSNPTVGNFSNRQKYFGD